MSYFTCLTLLNDLMTFMSAQGQFASLSHHELIKAVLALHPQSLTTRLLESTIHIDLLAYSLNIQTTLITK